MQDDQKQSPSSHAWWIVCVLLLTAVSFVFDIWGDKKSIRENPAVEYKFYSTVPVRDPFTKAETERSGFKYNCNNCHEHIDSPMVPRKLIAEHQGIIVDHEEAMTCYTCHSRKNREELNDIYGNKVAFEQSQNLCRRCHGPRYRDWKLGIHGRMTGHWDKAKGGATNLACVYCHNPHSPKFKPMKPSPPPVRDNYITQGAGTHHE